VTTSGADRSSARPAGRSVSTVSATAIGVGGMMGAGLYTLVGLAATTAGVWVPLSFLVAAIVALFSVYSTPAWEPSFRAGAGRPSSCCTASATGPYPAG
jgi:hypothetical protein